MRAPNSPVEGGAVRRAWLAWCTWLRWLNGDVAYQRFIAHLREHHPDRPAPSRVEFFRMETDRRWNGVRRCC